MDWLKTIGQRIAETLQIDFEISQSRSAGGLDQPGLRDQRSPGPHLLRQTQWP